MKELDICPICKKDFSGSHKSSTKLKQHIAKKEDPFHQLLRRHQVRWPATRYSLAMMEIRSQMEKLIEKYGNQKHYTEEYVIDEEDTNLEALDDWDEIAGK